VRLLRQFGLWYQLPRMRARAAAGPLRATARQYAQSRFLQAEAFLTWAADAGLQPAALTQADIDTWYATHLAHQRQAVRAFLVWAAGHGHVPGHLDIPRQAPSAGQAISQQRRIGLLRRFATDTSIAIRPRAAACLLLLYAQPLSRILHLTAGDLVRDDDGQTWLRLGDPPSPVPPPFDALLHQLAASRHDHVPANHASSWPFPGRHAGQPPATAACSPSSVTLACRCVPPGSPPCASLSCRSPLASSPAPSASTTPPRPASTSTQAQPGASTPQTVTGTR
jgi:integrase